MNQTNACDEKTKKRTDETSLLSHMQATRLQLFTGHQVVLFKMKVLTYQKALFPKSDFLKKKFLAKSRAYGLDAGKRLWFVIVSRVCVQLVT